MATEIATAYVTVKPTAVGGLTWLHKHLGGTEPLDVEPPASPLEVVR